MKALAKIIQKILTVIVILLILITVGIFAYPKFADKTEIGDKVVSFLAKQADKLVEETTEDANEGEEVGIGEDILEETTEEVVEVSDIMESSTSLEEVQKDASRTQTWSQEEKEELKKVYGTILNWMGLGEENLLFYEMKNVGDKEYYTFQVVDDFGDAYERLMYFDNDNKEMYWHERNGNLTTANSNDCIYSGKVQGQETVEYEDTDWKKVLDGYLKVMFDEQDREKASTYVDNSCYYLAALSENSRKQFIEESQKLQEEIISLSENYKSQKTAKVIDDYKWKYQILAAEEYVDEYDMDWVDVQLAFHIDVTQHKQTEYYGEDYIVRLREYEYGWRVASICKVE